MTFVIIFLVASGVLWAAAAFCSAVMDDIRDHRFTNVFPDTEWWNSKWEPDEHTVLFTVFGFEVTNPFYDAWHTFKFIMLVCLALRDVSLVTAGIFIGLNIEEFPSLLPYAGAIVGYFGWQSVSWWGTFELFYAKWLVKK